jgi:uncharacterized membrane protein HdeD (DUF308 family)
MTHAEPATPAMSLSAPRDTADTLATLGRSRAWIITYGVLTVLAGIGVLVWPGVTLLTLAILFAVQLFILGVFRIVGAFAVPDTSAGMRVLAVIVGIVSVIVGVLCLRTPLQTIVVLTLVLGLFWLVNGITELVMGLAGRGEPGRGWTILSGVIGVLGGIIVLSAPVRSAVTLAVVLGIVLLAHGIVVTVGGIRGTGPAEQPAERPAEA